MALGRARLEQPSRYLIDERPVTAEEIETELDRLNRAVAFARAELAALREKLSGVFAHEVGEFIDAHSLILADREL
ncbi:MAG TPA: phosphoenolpyruvate-utilizing N-terminal domain-containing protein, partial [Rhodanobacteraceae bacterium]|nr:phosphoenolpyruvate-utilizing N-terminal domain-containing protein [Rhodanobacteraceae bacterium]